MRVPTVSNRQPGEQDHRVPTAARDIAGLLGPAIALAEAEGLTMLAYLLEVAKREAEEKARLKG